MIVCPAYLLRRLADQIDSGAVVVTLADIRHNMVGDEPSGEHQIVLEYEDANKPRFVRVDADAKT